MDKTVQIILMFALVSLAGETGFAAEPDIVRFTARVRNIASITDYSGHITVAEIDPRFVLTFEILAVHTNSLDFAAKQTISFAIHSPAQLFATADTKHVVGRTFDFSVRRTRADFQTRYFSLSAVSRK